MIKFSSSSRIGFGITLCFISVCILSGRLMADVMDDSVWQSALRPHYFGDRSIHESDDVIILEAPVRAEDPAVVPIKIKAMIPQTEQRYIKMITVIIDKNPAPLAGRFRFSPSNGMANLATRIRINEYSRVRAVAETNDGALHMSSRFVKASGGCSAPVGTALEAAMARLGKIKFRTRQGSGVNGEVIHTQLSISHPNITGLQMDQLSRMYMPADFVKEIHVLMDEEPVFSAETDISISENPNFRFNVLPGKHGRLKAEVIDSTGRRFSQSYPVAHD